MTDGRLSRLHVEGLVAAQPVDRVSSVVLGALVAAQPVDVVSHLHLEVLWSDAIPAGPSGTSSAGATSGAQATASITLAGTATPSALSSAAAAAALISNATGSGVGVSGGHAIASVGVDIVPASGAGAGVSGASAVASRALTGVADGSAASGALADAVSFAQPTGTNRANRGNGIRLSGSATVDVQPPLEDDPPNLTTVPIHIITPTVPAPTLVNGRPQ